MAGKSLQVIGLRICPMALDLMENDKTKAFWLLTIIARREAIYGKAEMGSYLNWGFTRSEFRHALDRLVSLELVEIVSTCRSHEGSTVRLADDRVYILSEHETTMTATMRPKERSHDSDHEAENSRGSKSNIISDAFSVPDDWESPNLFNSTIPVPKTFSKRRCFDIGFTLGIPDAQIEQFYLHYESQGWVRGNGQPITNLHTMMQNWKVNSYKFETDKLDRKSKVKKSREKL